MAMDFSYMKTQVENRVDDQPGVDSIMAWINAGLGVMGAKVDAIFPTITSTSDTFVFDDKWAEIPILYACFRFKQSDLMTQDAQFYYQQFNELLKEFATRYQVPPQYKDTANSQQFTASAMQTDFTITKDSFSSDISDLILYKNNVKLPSDAFTMTDTGFTLDNATNAGDFITAIWEPRAELEEPPYTWWTW